MYNSANYNVIYICLKLLGLFDGGSALQYVFK